MCTYTYAPLCAVRGNTGVEKEETLLSLRPPLGLVLPVTWSPLILFSLTVPVVSLSLSLSFLVPRIRSLRASYSLLPLFVSFSVSARSLMSSLRFPLVSLILFSLSILLSTCFIRDYASCIACRSGADILLLVRCNC